MTRWHVLQGEILDFPADGLLCSANPNLNLSGGVGGAFALRYGSEMQRYLHDHLVKIGRKNVAPGESVICPPCGSPYVAVAQAVSIDIFYDTDVDTICLTYESALRGLAASGCKTVASACLGCGYGRVSPSDFLDVLTRLYDHSVEGIDQVTLVTTNSTLVDTLREKFPGMFAK